MIPQFVFKTGELVAALQEAPKPVKQGAATALNLTAEQAFAVIRPKMMREFHIRAPAFDLPPLQLPSIWRAKPDRLFVNIALGFDDGPSSIGGRRMAIFSKFGVAQTKAWRGANQPIAIPTQEIRPSADALVPVGLYPKNLRVMERMQPNGTMLAPKALGTKRSHTIKVGKLKLKQQDRTFIMPNSFGKKSWGVWERIGSAARDVRLIWIYKTQIPIPKKMSFEDDVRQVIDERLEINFTGAVILASAGRLWGNAKRS